MMCGARTGRAQEVLAGLVRSLPDDFELRARFETAVERAEAEVESWREQWRDGIGGADTELGSGLRGLADRVEALEGRLRIWSPTGGGTRLRAEIPCVS